MMSIFLNVTISRLSFSRSTSVKNLTASAGNVRDADSIPGWWRSPRGGHGNPLLILAWRIPWIEDPYGLQSTRLYTSQTLLKQLSTHAHIYYLSSVQFISVAQLCLTPCDPMNRSTPGLPVHHQLPEFTHFEKCSFRSLLIFKLDYLFVIEL